MTITHSESGAPPAPRVILADLLAELAAADRAHVLILAPIVVDQPVCAFCDPAWESGVVVATVACVTGHDRLIRRSVCARCVHSAVVWGTSEGYGVTLRATLGSAQ